MGILPINIRGVGLDHWTNGVIKYSHINMHIGRMRIWKNPECPSAG